MNKSKVFQIILLVIGLSIFIFTYLSIFQKNLFFFKKGSSNHLIETDKTEMKKIVQKNKNNTNVIKEDENASSIINNLSYKNIDYKGNVFNINSKITKIFENKKDLNFMEVVVARIVLLDGKVIEIFSDKAIYDTVSYNTKFFGNVVIVENKNKINSNNLDFFFDKKLVTIYNDVRYKGYNKSLKADKVDINLLNNKVYVYMNDKMSKVKINFEN